MQIMIMKSVTNVQLIVGEGWRQLFGLDVMVVMDGSIQSVLEQQKKMWIKVNDTAANVSTTDIEYKLTPELSYFVHLLHCKINIYGLMELYDNLPVISHCKQLYVTSYCATSFCKPATVTSRNQW